MPIDVNALYQQLGKQVRRLRKQRRLTQDSLSLALSVTRSTITNIELGNQRPPLHMIYELAEYFDVPLRELLPPWQRITTTLSEQDRLLKEKSDLTEQLAGVERDRATIKERLKEIVALLATEDEHDHA